MTCNFDRAVEIEQTFKIADGVYLVGSLETGVTVYKQQLRAHNLVWALSVCSAAAVPKSIAIVGGGITGLTVASCVLALFPDSEATLLEKRWELCSLQLGCDTRWLHPKIYDWPEYGSRAQSAQLPVLDWTAGRASDVARNIVQKFGAFCEKNQARLRIIVGLRSIQIRASDRHIEWMGCKMSSDGTFSYDNHPEGASEKFDVIIAAPGYSLEANTPLYWQNEQLSQPVLDGGQQNYLVSGYGDGAIVDLCRLTISRFRQDTILKDLFGPALKETEEEVLNALQTERTSYHDLLSRRLEPITRPAAIALAKRIRRDTNVIMHLSGRNANRSIDVAFEHQSSFLNKLLFYLLYKCGAFAPNFDTLEDALRSKGIDDSSLVRRHGSSPEEYVRRLFVDPENVEPQFASIRHRQHAEKLWRLGAFPPPGVRP
jgi:hypothetical protein